MEATSRKLERARSWLRQSAAAGRVIIGGAILLAAGLKLTQGPAQGGPTGVSAFAESIRTNGVIPSSLAYSAAWSVLIVETMVGLWLLSYRGAVHASIAAIALLGAFSLYLAVGRIMGMDPDCGCFGRISNHDVLMSILRNTAFMALLSLSLPAAARAPMPCPAGCTRERNDSSTGAGAKSMSANGIEALP